MPDDGKWRPSDITWRVASPAVDTLRPYRSAMGEELYEQSKAALRELLCGYINSDAGCIERLGSTVCPCGRSDRGGKVLKVRFALPGRGKSGSLRLAVVAYCSDAAVTLVAAWDRRDDPKIDEFIEAARGH